MYITTSKEITSAAVDMQSTKAINATTNNAMNDPQLLQDARDAAQHMVVKWIRSVFRELSYQLLKDLWKVEHVDKNDDSAEKEEEGEKETTATTTPSTVCRLHITTDMLDQVQYKCQQVANRWCQKLRTQGHYETTDWIQHVVVQEGPSVFFTPENDDTPLLREAVASGVDDEAPTLRQLQREEETMTNSEEEREEEEEEHDDGGGDDDTVSKPNAGNDDEIHTKTSTTSTQQQEASQTTTEDISCTAAPDSSERQQIAITDFVCIPSLSAVDVRAQQYYQASENDHRSRIEQLDQMMTARQNSSNDADQYYWNVIQRATANIPERCHEKRNNFQPQQAAGSAGLFQLQLVPAEQQQNEEDKEDEDPTTTIIMEDDNNENNERSDDNDEDGTSALLSKQMKQIVERKRKRMPGQRQYGADGQWTQPPSSAQHHNKKVARAKDHDFIHDIPRPAATYAEWKESWNKISKEIATLYHDELMTYMHVDDDHDDNNTKLPNNTLLGALKPVGQIHCSIQGPYDDPEIATSTMDLNYHSTTLTPSERRRLRRRLTKARKERLGHHQEEKDVKDPRARWSKVLRTAQLSSSISNTTTTALASSTAVAEEEKEGDESKEYWWDLDVGECLLELEEQEEGDDGGSKRRILCAFSSLEIMLLDQDADKKGNSQA